LHVTLTPATVEDWTRIRAWLNDPAIISWWGPPTQTEGAVLAALRTEHAIARFIEVDGRRVGYAHAVDATTWGEALPEDLPPGTWDIDLFIADPLARGQGIGVEALKAMKAEVFASTLAVAVCVFPSVANERAVRAYEKAGFAWQNVWRDPSSGAASWFMIAGRD
jgi:RimJ/RimL family protein N-acetyltransferase